MRYFRVGFLLVLTVLVLTLTIPFTTVYGYSGSFVDPEGDTINNFVDIIDVTASKDTPDAEYTIFEVTLAGDIPTDSFISDGGGLGDEEFYLIQIVIALTPNDLIIIWLNWESKPWSVEVYDGSFNLQSKDEYPDSLTYLTHQQNKLTLNFPSIILGNSNDFTWRVSSEYEKWIDFNQVNDVVSDKAPDDGTYSFQYSTDSSETSTPETSTPETSTSSGTNGMEWFFTVTSLAVSAVVIFRKRLKTRL